MKRIFFLLVILFLISCATGGYPPSKIAQADRELKRFRENFLEGRFCKAEDAFKRAVTLYSLVDSACDISEAYLQRYLFYSYIGMKREGILQKAIEFARLKKDCEYQLARVLSYSENKGEPSNDPLFNSVSLRKKGIQKREPSYIERAADIDREMGWSALLWYDLKILSELYEDIEKKDSYVKRASLIEMNLEINCLSLSE